MKEIEIKILEINRKEIEKKLIALGAKKIFNGEIDALFFDFKDKSLRKIGNTLRLRKEGNKTILTFKKPIEKKRAKIKEELEIEVSGFDTMKIILESLGFCVWKRMKKHRTSYELKRVHFEFDTYKEKYKFIPEFLEIEAKDIETIYGFVRLLGFKNEDCKPWSSQDLIKYYSQSKK